MTTFAGKSLLVLLLSVASHAGELRVLTFNAAGIPLVHGSVSKRCRQAGEAIKAENYDVVGLQELWFDGDADILAAASDLRHHARAPRRWKLGTGLSLLTRAEPSETSERMFTMRPSVLRFYQGESIARKGVQRVRLRLGFGELDVYNTHLVAYYRPGNARYRTLRLSQVFDLWEFIREESGERPYIVMGDLNSGLGEEAYQALLDLTGLQDPGPVGRGIDHVLVPSKKGVRLRLVLQGLSDHEGVEAVIDEASLRRPAKTDPAKRKAALDLIDGALAAMEFEIRARMSARSWIPFYGLALSLRYEHQLRQIADLRARIASSR